MVYEQQRGDKVVTMVLKEKCQRCKSDRVFEITAKSSDLNVSAFQGEECDGYAPNVLNVCGGDYVEVHICLECGQAQTQSGCDWPVPDPDFSVDCS